MPEPSSERSRQMNLRFTPEQYGQLAILSSLFESSAGELAYELVLEGLQKRLELPEVKQLLDGAQPAREAIESIKPQ